MRQLKTTKYNYKVIFEEYVYYFIGQDIYQCTLWGKHICAFRHREIDLPTSFMYNQALYISFSNVIQSLSIERLITFRGHGDRITNILIHGGYLYSSSKDHTIRKWNLEGECLAIFQGHNDYVTDILFYNDYLYSCSWDNTIRKWDKSGNMLCVDNAAYCLIKTYKTSDKTLLYNYGEFKLDIYLLDYSLCPQNRQYFRGQDWRTIYYVLEILRPWGLRNLAPQICGYLRGGTD